MLYRRRAYPQALQAAERAVARGSGLGRVERGFILPELPGGRRRAAAAVREALAQRDLGYWRSCAPMILLLLGRELDAVQAGRRIAGEPGQVPPWYGGWYQHYAAYCCGRISADELLQAAGTCRPKLCEAHFQIGLRRLAAGDRNGARRHFQKSSDTDVYIYWDHKWARAFLQRLKDDRDWPSWIPVKPRR
jgi:hypothetical protein